MSSCPEDFTRPHPKQGVGLRSIQGNWGLALAFPFIVLFRWARPPGHQSGRAWDPNQRLAGLVTYKLNTRELNILGQIAEYELLLDQLLMLQREVARRPKFVGLCLLMLHLHHVVSGHTAEGCAQSSGHAP